MTEFELQSHIYHKLIELYGIKRVRGEYRYKSGNLTAIFDLVILNDSEELELVIEIKRSKRKLRQHQRKGFPQLNKYKSMVDCPVIVLGGKRQVDQWIRKLST